MNIVNIVNIKNIMNIMNIMNICFQANLIWKSQSHLWLNILDVVGGDNCCLDVNINDKYSDEFDNHGGGMKY